MGAFARGQLGVALAAAGGLVGQLPAMLRSPDHALAPVSLGRGGRVPDRPVICVHGFAATPSCWTPLAVRLASEGFSHVHTFSYNSLTCDLDTAARELALAARLLMRQTGHDHVHLVGHSLGGLLVRAAVERHGLRSDVGGLVTIATPHRGSSWSRLTPGPSRSWLQTRRPVLPAPVVQGDDDRSLTYLNYFSAKDAVVPVASAFLDHPGVQNHELTGVGHLGAAASTQLLALLPGHLHDVDARRDSGALNSSAPLLT